MTVETNTKNALTIALLDDVFTAASALAAQYAAKPEEYAEINTEDTQVLIKAYHQESWFHQGRRGAALTAVRGGAGGESSNLILELERNGKLWAENARKAVDRDVLKDGLEPAADRLVSLLKNRFPANESVNDLVSSMMTAFEEAQKVFIRIGERRLGKKPPQDWATNEEYDAHQMLQIALGERSRGDFQARKRRLALLHKLVDAVLADSSTTKKDERKNKLYSVAVAWANEPG